ncbi:transketolase family protein [Candidatus Acetothermia bacterium]|nr:transketolase family protein [Candidatus Acetothermia bacterium]
MVTFAETRNAYGETLVELGAKDKEIVALTADLPASTRVQWFGQKYPERFFDFGVAEANMIGAAAGLAASGKKPFVSTFAVFATGKAWEQIRQNIAYPNLPVKIVCTHAGLTVGEDGASHQTIEDIGLMRVLPNMTVIAPAYAIETKQVIRAIVNHPGPVYVRLARAPFPVIYGDDHQFDLGRLHVVKEGRDVTIFACGLMVYPSLVAAEQLAQEKISARIVNVATVKPLDPRVAELAAQTGGAVTVEEHNVIGGLGSAIAEAVSEAQPVPLERVGIRDKFGQSGKPEELLKLYGLTSESIVAAVKRVLARRR